MATSNTQTALTPTRARMERGRSLVDTHLIRYALTRLS